MNRADKLLSVLRDGREHSRHDVFAAQGFMLTNNAAAELRARGFNVVHRRKGGVDTYQLLGSLDEAADAHAFPPAAASSSEPSNPRASLADHAAASPPRDGELAQLSLEAIR